MSEERQRRMRVMELIAEIAELEPGEVHGGDRLREDLGMDSLGSLELLSTLSQELELDFEMEDAMGIETVDDACTFMEAVYAAHHAPQAVHARQ